MVVGDHSARIVSEPCNALLNDAVGLLHLFHTNQIAVIHVTGFANRNIKIHLVVNIVRLLFTQVPSDARTTQHGPRKAHIQSALGGHNADVDCSLFPYAVVRQEGVVLL